MIKLPFIVPVYILLNATHTQDKPSILISPKMPLLEGISLPLILKNLICFGPTETKLFSFIQVASSTLAPSTLMQEIKLILPKFDVSHIAIELKSSCPLPKSLVPVSLNFKILIARCNTPFKL